MKILREDADWMRRPSLRRFYDGRRVLVVGGDGFLGRNSVEPLVALGARVSILTRRRAAVGRSDAIEQVFVGDLREPGLVRDAVSDKTVVFDFAGSSGAVDSNRHPELDLERECRAKLNLFTACAEAERRPKVLFCSSRLVYGPPLYVPVDEKHPLSPQSFYAAHKIAAESYLKVLGQTHQLRSTVLRVSNPYGPYQSDGHKSYGVINQFLQRAARLEPIRVYGDGIQIRDYVHAGDLVAVFLLCGESSRCDGEIFNVGGREPVRLRDAAETITRLAGSPPVELAAWPADYEAVETGDYVTDLTKLDRTLGRVGQLRLDEGLSLSLEAYREIAGSHSAPAAVTRSDSSSSEARA